jgi:hypothetical protein
MPTKKQSSWLFFQRLFAERRRLSHIFLVLAKPILLEIAYSQRESLDITIL